MEIEVRVCDYCCYAENDKNKLVCSNHMVQDDPTKIWKTYTITFKFKRFFAKIYFNLKIFMLTILQYPTD